MIIRTTILVFALMFYMMITAGGHTTRAALSPAGDDSSPKTGHAAAPGEKPAEAQTAASAERAVPESTKPHQASDLVRISAYSQPQVTVHSATWPESMTGFSLLDERALHGLTYAAAETLISEQLTGQSAAHGPQITVRQALILGCGLMMREAERTMGMNRPGKYEKLGTHLPLADSSRSISVPQLSERTY